MGEEEEDYGGSWSKKKKKKEEKKAISERRKGRLKSCTWRRQRSIIHWGMRCQAEWVGGSRVAAMSYSDKADSDDHTMAAALVFLFAFGLRRRWTFLFLEFPGSREKRRAVTTRRTHTRLDICGNVSNWEGPISWLISCVVFFFLMSLLIYFSCTVLFKGRYGGASG